MAYSLYPSFVEITYSNGSLMHKARIGVNATDAENANEWGFICKDNTYVEWKTAIDGYIDVVKAISGTQVTYLYADLWTYATTTSDPVWSDNYALGVAGTGSGATQSNMAILSYRDGAGGNGKLVVIGASLTPNQSLRPPTYTIAAVDAWVDNVTLATTFIYSRRGSYPEFVPRVLTKTYDSVRKKLLLDT